MSTNNLLKEEANQLLNFGLYNLLNNYSEVIFTGSYELDLMVWRDLDIYIDVSNVNQEDIYNIMNDIFRLYKPVWAETKDTFLEDSGCPKGYFLGFETKIVNDQLWNIDIWFTNIEYIDKNKDYIKKIKEQLTEKTINNILDLKSILYSGTEYGKRVFSVDIYEAVLKYGVNGLDEFKIWVKKHKNIDL